MVTVKFESVFQIGDRVYYNLPESPVGIVIDVTYRHSVGAVLYEIQWNPEENSSVCRDYELSTERIIV